DGEPVLLIGDSVLAGDVMQGKVADWKQHRVIDAMRRAANPESKARFHQVALDAMLPVDILHVVQELDAHDPAGRIPVVIELNPRYFSASYAEAGECTRGWLCEIGPTLLTKNNEWRMHVATPWLWDLLLGTIADHTPLLRLRSELRGDFVDRAIATLLPRRDAEPPDVLAARARVLAHYTGLKTANTSKQVQALQSTVARLRATGRRALFFTTPLEDGFLAEAMEPHKYGRYIARMSELVDRSDAPFVELVNLDHPLFSSSLFLDHCHLGPEGNRRLAVNLLAELGIGLAEVPDDDELVDLELPDRTVVSRAEQGFSDGASWQALFNKPRGLAVAPGGHRVVIADSGNHVLRELSGNLRTVRTILGTPGEAGDVDGSRSKARLDRPAFPVLIGRAVYFSDQQGKKLRVFVDGKSRTVQTLVGEHFAKISGLAAHGGRLLILDRNRRIIELDPESSTARVVVDALEGLKLKVFAVAPDGRIFVADQDDRIWMGELGDAPITVGIEDEGMTLEFPNTGAAVMPQVKGLYFPLDYNRIRFANIVGMTWVDRYGTLLVQDDIPLERLVKGMTERIQLRMIDPQSHLVYPWLKPITYGGGYMLYNKRSKSFTSYFHEGSMALDQGTATLFWLERNRSRMFYVADGVLGTSKIGHIRDLFAQGFRDLLGHHSATQTFSAFKPQRFLDRRLERLPREGPYQGVIIGSSMLSKSDMIGSYSFGVRLERRLRDALGYRDGVGFELFQRSYGGVPSEKVLQELRSMLDAGAQLDVIFIELCGSRNRFFETGATDERMREILAEVDDIARQYESMVIFFDDSAIVSGPRDGNRGTPDSERRFQEMARQAGYQVIDLGAELMRDALELSPFGSPPFPSHHAAPWAIDEAADMLGDRAYPVLREHLRDRVPAYLRAPLDPSQDQGAIADVFAEVDASWEELLPAVTDVSAQSTLVGDELKIFVDLGRIEVDTSSTDALDDVAVAALHMFIVGDPAGARARKVDVQLANFSRYDEYGAGVRDAAEVVRRHQLDRDGVIELLTRVRARAR
ncbi:MAG TPA: hypothetical protein VG755_03680, partial [Nannocystaceae bacterium]|nr:hypothetical protein [Nannocystaceae bacterium]